jgi:hypothetical protein
MFHYQDQYQPEYKKVPMGPYSFCGRHCYRLEHQLKFQAKYSTFVARIEIFLPRRSQKVCFVSLSRTMSGIPSQISLDDAVVAQDEMGRPFIIVREYIPFIQDANIRLQPGSEKEVPKLIVVEELWLTRNVDFTVLTLSNHIFWRQRQYLEFFGRR